MGDYQQPARSCTLTFDGIDVSSAKIHPQSQSGIKRSRSAKRTARRLRYKTLMRLDRPKLHHFLLPTASSLHLDCSILSPDHFQGRSKLNTPTSHKTKRRIPLGLDIQNIISTTSSSKPLQETYHLSSNIMSYHPAYPQTYYPYPVAPTGHYSMAAAGAQGYPTGYTISSQYCQPNLGSQPVSSPTTWRQALKELAERNHLTLLYQELEIPSPGHAQEWGMVVRVTRRNKEDVALVEERALRYSSKADAKEAVSALAVGKMSQLGYR